MPYKISGPNDTVVGIRVTETPNGNKIRKPVLILDEIPADAPPGLFEGPCLFDTQESAEGAMAAMQASQPRMRYLELKVEAAE